MPDYDWRLVNSGDHSRLKWCTPYDAELINSGKYIPAIYNHRDDGPLYKISTNVIQYGKTRLHSQYLWVWYGIRFSFDEWCRLAEFDEEEKAMLVLTYA